MDEHNTNVDPDLVVAGRCGVVHLATGRRCRREARHAGGCDFSAPRARGSRTGPETGPG